MVTLEQAKLFCRVDFDDGDESIILMIASAKHHLESIGINCEVDPLPPAIHRAVLLLVSGMYDGHDDHLEFVNRLVAPFTEKTL